MIPLAFGLSAATGTLLRWLCTRWNRPRLPLGTLLVNVAASFVAGLVADAGATASLIVGVAGAGALSTVSTLVREVADAVDRRDRVLATGYLAVTLLAGVTAAATGLALG